MAYFTTDEYAGKREYAAKIADESIAVLSEKTGISADALECVKTLSALRHEIHSTDRSSFAADGSRDLLNSVGTQFSVEYNLLNAVNGLHLIDKSVECIEEPEVSSEDSAEDILDYFGWEIQDGDAWQTAHEALVYGWDDAINNWSDSVRAWFRELNNKYGTKFPC